MALKFVSVEKVQAMDELGRWENGRIIVEEGDSGYMIFLWNYVEV